ncbi:MAG: enoyl-CoA hydratase/isomerase family protein [Actinobacteria bacterium]|nr:enoyl-CoA hydratase/isomerase family protein [Actinomycetota bacterium]
MSAPLRVEQRTDGVRRLVLDRPDARNAISVEMRELLVDAVVAARRDPDARCLLLTGAGDAFCSGMDLRESTVKDAGAEDFDPRSTSETLRTGIQALIRELWELDKPTVAAVNGVAVGPGAHIALACDFVLTRPETRFVWSFSRWGLVADAGGAYLLPRLVGMARAKELVLLGDDVDGERAVALGLAYRCCEDLDTEAEELAGRLAVMPTRAVGLSKRLLNTAFETDLPALLETEGHYQALATTTDDLVEGMAAFREKRAPHFRGR